MYFVVVGIEDEVEDELDDELEDGAEEDDDEEAVLEAWEVRELLDCIDVERELVVELSEVT